MEWKARRSNWAVGMNGHQKKLKKSSMSLSFLLYVGCAWLLVYGASAGFAKQSSAPQPDEAIAVFVKSFSIVASGILPTGRTIHASLDGSPAGKAYFSIPNVADSIPMNEISPGCYTGEYTTKSTDVNDAAVYGQLVENGTRSPLICASNRISIDTTPPKIYDLFPAEGDVVCDPFPLIYCGLDDGGGTGIDQSHTVVQLDGKIVTKSYPSPVGIAFRPGYLAPGDHLLLIVTSDMAGNTVQAQSQFTVVDSKPLAISPPVIDADVTDQLVYFRETPTDFWISAPPNLKVNGYLAGIDAPMSFTEVHPGDYRGKFKPSPGMNFTNLVGIVQIVDGTGKKFVLTYDYVVNAKGPAPTTPEITEPGSEDYYQGSIQVAGKAQPLTRIVCSVTYDTRSDGGVLPFNANLLTYVTKSNNKGDWTAGPFGMHVNSLFAYNRDTRMWLNVVAEDASGQMSEPARTRLFFSP